MMKEVLRTLDPGLLPEIGLIAFLSVFVLILIRVALLSKDEREAGKHMPLDDADDFSLLINHE